MAASGREPPREAASAAGEIAPFHPIDVHAAGVAAEERQPLFRGQQRWRRIAPAFATKTAAHEPREAPEAEMEQAHLEAGLKADCLERGKMMRKEVQIGHVDIANEPPARLSEVL